MGLKRAAFNLNPLMVIEQCVNYISDILQIVGSTVLAHFIPHMKISLDEDEL